MYVDCMNTENVPDIDKKQLDRITGHALGAAGLHAQKLVIYHLSTDNIISVIYIVACNTPGVVHEAKCFKYKS